MKHSKFSSFDGCKCCLRKQIGLVRVLTFELIGALVQYQNSAANFPQSSYLEGTGTRLYGGLEKVRQGGGGDGQCPHLKLTPGKEMSLTSHSPMTFTLNAALDTC